MPKQKTQWAEQTYDDINAKPGLALSRAMHATVQLQGRAFQALWVLKKAKEESKINALDSTFWNGVAEVLDDLNEI